MPLDFPGSPTNGQVYDNYYYDQSTGAWRSLSSTINPIPSTLKNVTVSSSETTGVSLRVTPFTTSSVNLQEWYNTLSTVVASMNVAGELSVAKLIPTTDLELAHGGTNASLTAVNGGVVYSTASAMAITAAGTSGQILKSNAAAAPTWQTLDLTYLPDAAFKKSVRAATTANITLSGTQTIDTIALVAGDRVLVKNQTAPAENGIYKVASGSWTRPADTNLASEMGGAVVNVDSGTQGGQLWTTNFKTTDTLGTTAMNWYQVIDTSGATFSAQITATNYRTPVTTEASDTIGITFNTESGLLTRAAAGTVTFTGASYTAGVTVTCRVVAGAAQRTLAFPAGWVFVGSKPTAIAANKSGILTVTSFGTTEADCIASWVVQL